jgi:two-component system, OmpR family, response regulator CpxR
MPTISVFSGSFCNTKDVVESLASETGCRLVRDEDLVAAAAARSGFGAAKIARVFTGKPSVFNTFTHERERSLASLKFCLAEMLQAESLIVSGFAAHLIPKTITHILRVCMVADLKSRTAAAALAGAKDPTRVIRQQDEEAAAWVHAVTGSADPWAPALYDILIPLDKTSPESASELVLRHCRQEILQPTPASRQAMSDFALASKVEEQLTREGHNVLVEAENGAVLLTINKHVLMLSRLEEDLKSIASRVDGVQSVTTKVGKGYYQTDIYRKADFELPSKVLLVDDEREFVQTLSERLLMRDMGSAVAYDGESALSMINEDEPEVMILDLKMPGIDGIEVLRRVKQSRPEIEVIILTGHGSQADRKTCLDLGAFAYLQKPVDIDLLTETLKKAKAKMQQNLSR